MKTLIAPDREAIYALAERLKKAEGKPEFQRIQCILLRLTLQASARDIAQVVGWTTGTVRVMHSHFAKLGDAFFDITKRGGRHRQNLTLEEEVQFLKPFFDRAKTGQHPGGLGDQAGLRSGLGSKGCREHDLSAPGTTQLAEDRTPSQTPQSRSGGAGRL